MRTIARACHDNGRLGTSFFFVRGRKELESAHKFVTTIAVQLARVSPELRRHICAAIAARPDINDCSLHDQWQQLVLRPFEAYTVAATVATLLPLVLVVDALDECYGEAEVCFMLKLLSEMASVRVCQLRVFATSWPKIPICLGLANIPAAQQQQLILYNIEKSVADRDLYVFFETRLGAVRQERELAPTWPSASSIQRLVQRAGGLFIWAATACRFIRAGGSCAARRLTDLLGSDISSSKPEHGLDLIYIRVLQTSIAYEATADEIIVHCQFLKTVLSLLAVLSSMLSVHALAALLQRSEHKVVSALFTLHSIIDVPNASDMPIRLRHASVRDFLLSSRRCSNTQFYVDKEWAHTVLAMRCLILMDKQLKRDLCNL